MSSSILLIDNYDSFVYNLARYFEELGVKTIVARNDSLNLQDIAEFAPKAIVISPGPCTPQEAGLSIKIIKEFHLTVPILGVCLGHQAIAEAFGGRVIRAREPMHGRESFIHHHSQDLFEGYSTPHRVGRYHSLIVDEDSLPVELEVTARTSSGTIMAIQHRNAPVFGVQFHPESILTNDGHRMLQNFLKLAGIESSPGSKLSELLEVQDITLQNDFYEQEIAPDAHRPL